MQEGWGGCGGHLCGVGGEIIWEEGEQFGDGVAELRGVLGCGVDWDVEDFGCSILG